MSDEIDQVRQSWDSKAKDWHSQVGEQGDWNRRLCSDPVLFELLGKIKHKSILDAGCGTGYLSNKLESSGADVVGVDLSPEMIRTAQQNYPELEFRVDDCSTLSTIPDGEMDAVVSNYVLMDTPNLAKAVQSIFRVLRPGGLAVVVFSHPCFPQSSARVNANQTISYDWKHPYYEQSQQQDPPWKHFKTDFIWYHRSLEQYWKEFLAAGFRVADLREPRIAPEHYHLAPNLQSLHTYQERPLSIAFKLFRPNH